MTNALDLTNLRDITDGDAELESMLLRTFLNSANASFQALRAASLGGDAEDWRKTAHALKGTALNIGAVPLSELCKNAESAPQSTSEEKRHFLKAIETELTIVCAEITAQLTKLG